MGDTPLIRRELPCQRSYSFTPEDADKGVDVLDLAARMAFERGGQTEPLSEYDIARATFEITGEQSEISRLAAALEAAEAEKKRLREALANLVEHCHEQERQLTEELHHTDYCGESAPLTEARNALEETDK